MATPFPAATHFADGARHDRFAVAPGLDCWTYAFDGKSGARRGALSTSLQVAAHLGGAWVQRSQRAGLRAYEGETLHTLSPGERFDLTFKGARDAGLVVGFMVYPEEFFGEQHDDRELLLDPQATDPALVAACRAVVEARATGRPLPDIAPVVRAFMQRAADVSPADPVWRVKKEIDATVDRELYVEHLADAGGLHPRALQRSFRRRFGVSPVAYRTRLRLNMMARTLWMRRDLNVAEVAAQVGFNNPSYAHRAFARYFGTTPAVYACR